MMKLEEKLACLRKREGLSQMELAEAMEVSRQAISRWEAGATAPSTENLKCLSELYGVPLEVLLDDERTPEEWRAEQRAALEAQQQHFRKRTKKSQP